MSALIASLALAPAALGQLGWSDQGQFGNPVRWSTLGQGVDSQITRAETRLFSNQQEFDLYYARMCGFSPTQRVAGPRVADWRTQDVLIVHMGQQRTGGFGVYVETIRRTSPHYWDVQIVTIAPNPRSVLLPVITSPFVVVVIDRAIGVPRFTWRNIQSGVIIRQTDRNDCGGSWGGGQVPVWMVGKGGALIPMNQAAGRTGG